MPAVQRFADKGGLVIGICNGFQILCEAGMLPGVLTRNSHLQFRCQWVNLRVESSNSPFTNRCEVGDVLAVPISHGEGNYYAAGIANREGNVLGMMPHPERCCDPLVGGTDGLAIFRSILDFTERTAPAPIG